jgi:transposase
MAFIRGEAREQTTMFPVTLDELIPEDHMCRVVEGFVERLDMAKLGFVRAELADRGRPGYDPRDLLKLYLYGYLQQVRSWRRLEAECQRNVEVMWLLGRLQPDYKSIAEFRRMHRQAVTDAGAELVRFARSVGLVKGETVACSRRWIEVPCSEQCQKRAGTRCGGALSGTTGRGRRAG